ncbi:MAG: S41 family peptidase [Acetobacteraceae bacterium]
MRQFRCILGGILVLAAAFTVRAQAPHAKASAVFAIPNTPAARVLSAWLNACNSGDRKQLESFYKKYHQPVTDFARMICRPKAGFDLLSIIRSRPRKIEYVVAGRGSPGRAAGELDVTDTDPPYLSRNSLYLINSNAPVSALKFQVSSAVRAHVVRAVAAKLDQLYVYPEMGKELALGIISRWNRGQYDAVTYGFDFAQRLTSDLQASSHDKHLTVTFSPAELPRTFRGQSAASAVRERIQLERDNCGFKRAEWLPGNIGYLRFDGFDGPTVCRDTVAAAMGFLANADAIIFDLRENHGGLPGLVTLIESYLFASPTHLDDIWDRRTGRTTQTWTLPTIRGKRLPSIPVFILTSHRTFSGAEAFAYELQALKRATVVGEVTGGGGHLAISERVDSRFILNIPVARPINPVTKTDWEGTGVVPDVKVPASEALKVAEKLAAEEVAKRQSEKEVRKNSGIHSSG